MLSVQQHSRLSIVILFFFTLIQFVYAEVLLKYTSTVLLENFELCFVACNSLWKLGSIFPQALPQYIALEHGRPATFFESFSDSVYLRGLRQPNFSAIVQQEWCFTFLRGPPAPSGVVLAFLLNPKLRTVHHKRSHVSYTWKMYSQTI